MMSNAPPIMRGEPSAHVRVDKDRLRNFNTAMRVGVPGKPSPAQISNSPDTAPLGRVVPIGGDGAYAAMLERELPREAPPAKGMTLASFFCCGGGIDLGFRSAGLRTVFANDHHKAAADTFARNLGHEPVLRDIRQVGPGDYPKMPVDVVTGGFPCVTFSMAGRRAGVVDDLNGKLYLELCRVIRELRPRYFVAENVKGMLSANNGQAVKLVLAAFLRLGYRASFELVNMAEHGVPQTRERVVFVGVRLDQWRGSFAFPKKTHRLAGDKGATAWLPKARTLAEAIGDLGPPGQRLRGQQYGDAVVLGKDGLWRRKAGNYRHPGAKPASRSGLTQVSSNGNVLVVDQSVGDGSHDPNGAPLYEFNQTRRVASHEANDQPASGPHQMRRMTARECARVQSFPDWFEFCGSQSDHYRIIGNAVPPLYAKALAFAILEYDARPPA